MTKPMYTMQQIIDEKPIVVSTKAIKVTGQMTFERCWKQHLKGTPLEKTEYFESFKKWRGADAQRQWDVLFPVWQTMWTDIKTNGYKTKPLPHTGDGYIVDEYITVRMGPNGQLLFNNGIHRLAFCRILGIPTIAVKVVWRDPKWEELRNEIIKYATTDGRKMQIYTPLEHPDLQLFRSWWTPDRRALLRQHIDPASKTCLDVGSHWGYISMSVATKERRVTAIEKDTPCHKIAARLCRAHHANVRCIAGDVFKLPDTELSPDVLICVNILHHFTRAKESVDKLTALLGKIKCKQCFCAFENQQSAYAVKGFWNPEQRDMAAWVAKQLGLNTIEELGVECKRILFKLS